MGKLRLEIALAAAFYGRQIMDFFFYYNTKPTDAAMKSDGNQVPEIEGEIEEKLAIPPVKLGKALTKLPCFTRERQTFCISTIIRT